MSLENDGSVSKITTNSIGATYQFQTWLQNNNYHMLKDREGDTWFLEVISSLGPDPDDTQKGLWTIKVHVSTNLSSASLTRSKVLDHDRDRRLLSLIDGYSIPLDLHRPRLEGRSIEAARREIVEEIQSIKNLLGSSELAGIKRKYIGQWVDRHQLFGKK